MPQYHLVLATRHLVPCEWFVWWMPTLDPRYMPSPAFEIAWRAGRGVT